MAATRKLSVEKARAIVKAVSAIITSKTKSLKKIRGVLNKLETMISRAINDSIRVLKKDFEIIAPHIPKDILAEL